MAIQQAVPSSVLVELGQGIHNLASDTVNLALYTDQANLGPTTTAYTAVGEVATGNGYTAGGQAMTIANSGTLDGTTAVFSWDDVTWPLASFTARGAMSYNASKSNRAVGIYDFGGDVPGQGGDFIVRMPPATATQAIFRIAA